MQLNKDYETTINLKGLFFHILYRWRSILLFAVIGAIALGSYQYFSLKKTHDAGKLTKEERQYNLNLQNYKDNLANAENTITMNTRRLEGYYTYQNESIYFQLNPQAVWTASCKYLIKVDQAVLDALPQGSPIDPADSILPAYTSLLADATDEELREAFDTDKPAYVSEIAKVNTDADENSITVTVIGASKEAVQKGLKFLEEKVEAATEKAQEIDIHTLKKLDETTTRGVDDKLVKKQEEQTKAITQCNQDLQTARTKLDQLNTQGKPKEPGKHLGRMAAIGAILGVLLLIVLYGMKYILGGKLNDSDTLAEQYSLPILGAFARTGSIHNNRSLDKFFSKWETGKDITPEDTIYDNICALITEKQETGDLLLVSTLPAEKLKPVSEALAKRLPGRTIQAEGSFLTNSAAITASANMDAVILVEEKGTSSNKKIQRLAESLMISQANVIGAIIL